MKLPAKLLAPRRMLAASTRLVQRVDQASREDQAFLPATQRLTVADANSAAPVFVYSCAAFAFIGLLAMFLVRLDISVPAKGHIVPVGRSKVVQSLYSAKVERLFVHNGSDVRAGELLIALDETEPKAQHRLAEQDFQSASAEISRREAALASADLLAKARPCCPPIKFADWMPADLRMREEGFLLADLAKLRAQVSSLRAQIDSKTASKKRLSASVDEQIKVMKVNQDRLTMKETLVARNVGTKAGVIDARVQLERNQIDLTTSLGERAEVIAATHSLEAAVTASLSDFVADQQQKLEAAARQRDSAEQGVLEADAKLKAYRIIAPIGGRVQQMSVNAVGQIAEPGKPLLVVAPGAETIEVEAYVRGEDIGFVKLGQKVMIKVDAFPYTRYGMLEGKVTNINREAVDVRRDLQIDVTQVSSSSKPSALQSTQDLFYPVTVSLTSRSLSNGDAANLVRPGMTLTADIATGSRSTIQYIMSPVSN